jgi:hypothetical protein
MDRIAATPKATQEPSKAATTAEPDGSWLIEEGLALDSESEDEESGSDIPIEFPTRICIIGASSTGKTELIKRMILRGDFGTKRELEVMVLSPSPITLEQKVWKALESKGIRFTKIMLDKSTPPPPNPARGIKRLIIFDDLDTAKVIPQWVVERFTIASHHLNESVVCISHKVRIGVVEIRSSARWIILTAAPERILKDTCENMGCNYDDINKLLSDPKHIHEISEGQYGSFNHVAIRQAYCVDKDGNPAPKYFQVNNLTDTHTLRPLSLKN